jgi:CBS domain-containing protein
VLKVKDIMTKNVISVKKDTPIFQAIEILADNDITGIPVVEDDMTVIGILSEKDVLSVLYAPRENEDKVVNDFMTQPAICFEKDESVMDICDCLRESFFRRVLVTEHGKLVGIVSRKDIIKCILQARNKEPIVTIR